MLSIYTAPFIVALNLFCNATTADWSLLSELHVTTQDKLFTCIYLRHEAIVLEFRTDVNWNQNSRDATGP